MDSINITDLDLQALVDGQAADPLKNMIMDAIKRDPALYNRYLLYKKQQTLLKSWWKDH